MLMFAQIIVPLIWSQAFDTQLQETPAPKHDHARCDLESLGDLLVLQPITGQQNDALCITTRAATERPRASRCAA